MRSRLRGLALVEKRRLKLADAEALRAPDARYLLLPAVSLRADARASSDSEGDRRDLLVALAEPFTDRLLHLHLEAARIVIGRCELVAMRAEAARASVRDIRFSVTLESDAHAVRLAATTLTDAPTLASRRRCRATRQACAFSSLTAPGKARLRARLDGWTML